VFALNKADCVTNIDAFCSAKLPNKSLRATIVFYWVMELKSFKLIEIFIAVFSIIIEWIPIMDE